VRAAEAIDSCTPPSTTATVWAAPDVLKYQTVLEGSAEHEQHPTFKVFIELLTGSAADIDPASVTLNGVPASGPGLMGDNNLNGVPDLKVEFDRSLFEGNIEGTFTVSGQTTSGSSFSASSSIRICGVTRAQHDTYYIPFTTSNMQDQTLNGLPAQLEVRHVYPIFDDQSKDCQPTKAVIMVAGRSVEAIPVFDLDHGDYSLMEGLAWRGIDTYAFNLLGYGSSKILPEENDPLIQQRNASLPDCLALSMPPLPPSAPCAPVPGVCDCQGVPPIQTMNQQGLPRWLGKVTLEQHGSSTRFQRTPDQVADLGRVVANVQTMAPRAKIALLGYSAGGGVIGPYLDDSTRQRNIDRAIFLSSIFSASNTLLGEPAIPPSWPLGLLDYQATVGSLLAPTTCDGRTETGLVDALWDALKARDAVGAAWGPPKSANTGGMLRYPVVTRWGWQVEASRRISIPILAMVGALDTATPGGLASTVNIFLNSPQANTCGTSADCAPGYICETAFNPPMCRLNNRILAQVPCATHQILWESSSNVCNNPHLAVQKRVGDFILKGN
jgi:alpha-beta hydrolase superfamily lysophospholipase